MQTRTISAISHGWVKVAATLAIAAAAMSFAAPAVHAQSTTSTIGAIRLGEYIPVNSATQQTYGRYYLTGGLDYYFQQNQTTSRSVISVDYTEFSKSGNDIRVIPVTIGQQSMEAARGQSVRPYIGYGVGAYFIHLKDPNDTNFGGSDTENATAFGGFLEAGLDLTTNLFLDARYHIVTPVKSVNTDSLEITAGLRF